MSKSYKRSNGQIQMRGSGGKFRRTTFEDMGIYNGNKKLTTFICNICEREFIPVVLSGKCSCGSSDKREKIIMISPAQQAIQVEMEAINRKPFINRQDLEKYEALAREFRLSK